MRGGGAPLRFGASSLYHTLRQQFACQQNKGRRQKKGKSKKVKGKRKAETTFD